MRWFRYIGSFKKTRILLFGLFFFLIALISCTKEQISIHYADDESGDQDELTVETIVEAEERKVIEIPIPPNPYEDDFVYCDCRICCEKSCAVSEKSSEYEGFISTLKAEATSRADAAAEALLASGPDLMEYEDWQEIVTGCMDLLNNPTLVVVQLSSGEWKKVKLENVPEMDVEVKEIMMIQRSVGEKMKAALKAQMFSYDVPLAKADNIAGQIIKTYLENLLNQE